MGLTMLNTVFCPATDSSRPARSLSGIAFFEGLAESERERLVALCRWNRYDARQQVFGHEDEANDVYFIVSGRVRVTVFSASGKEVSFTDLGPGESFGELSAIDGARRSATVIALDETVLASMSAKAFRRVLADHADLAAKMMTYLAAMVRRLSDRIVEFSVLAVSNRVHAELLRLARERGVSEGAAVIKPAPTHAVIASRVATHREAVTKELNALARKGLIERRDGALVIADVARLARLVEAGFAE
jgi:CRP/FNR family transcriptional regulator, cyclic AMP receptor protein